MPTKSTEVLIVVMTYPHPSKKYQESVCTAGITRHGQWVRLYPVDWRYRPREQQFRKYQWIEVELEDGGQQNDNRPESRKPVLDSIKIIGEPLGKNQKDVWKHRRPLIESLAHHTLNEYKQQWDVDKTSLGVVRPKSVFDMEIRKCDDEWKPEWQAEFDQLRLFGPPQKPLRKLPYSFHYKFECDDGDTHTAMCEDWELGVLFLRESVRLGSDEKAAESVRAKYLNQLCDDSRDTRFFMGTKFPYNVWLVLGVYWPPKIQQLGLGF